MEETTMAPVTLLLLGPHGPPNPLATVGENGRNCAFSGFTGSFPEKMKLSIRLP